MMTFLSFALVGAAVGSFLNVVIDRLPRGESIIFPPSHCDTCQTSLKLWENIPLFSYLWLRGKCRQCGAPIPLRVLVVEVITSLFFVFLWRNYGFSAQLVLAAVYTCAFLALVFIDLEHQLLLNVIILPTLALALLASPLWLGTGVLQSLWQSLLGAAIGFSLLLLPHLLFPRGMGLGDVKMAALVGAVSGFPLVFLAIWLAFLGGGLIAVVLLITRLRKRKDAIPFGPFLAGGALIALYWGGPLWEWYLSLMGGLF